MQTTDLSACRLVQLFILFKGPTESATHWKHRFFRDDAGALGKISLGDDAIAFARNLVDLNGIIDGAVSEHICEEMRDIARLLFFLTG